MPYCVSFPPLVRQFGILLWELFCGSEPFVGVPRAHLGHAITKEGRRWDKGPGGAAGLVALGHTRWPFHTMPALMPHRITNSWRPVVVLSTCCTSCD